MRGSKAGTLRGSGAHTDSVLVRDLGLRTPSSSGRSRLSANFSDDMSLVAGDIFGDSGVVVVWTSSSRIVTIVGCRMSRVTARTRRAITIKKPIVLSRLAAICAAGATSLRLVTKARF